MADYYVDPVNGDDADTGGSGDPFATYQAAWDVAVGGDTIHGADTGFDVMSSSLDASSSGTSSTSRIAVVPWEVDGTLTNWKGEPAWGMDGNNVVGFLVNPLNSYTDWQNGLFKNATSHALFLESLCTATGCEFFDNGGIGMWSNRGNIVVRGCKAHGNASYGFSVTSGGEFHDCWADNNGNVGFYLGGTAATNMTGCLSTNNSNYGCWAQSGKSEIRYCVFYNNTTYHIRLANAVVTNCTFIKGAGTANSALWGGTGTYIYNNLFLDFTGGSCKPLDLGGNDHKIIGHNAYYNCAANTLGTILYDYTAFDVTEPVDPLTDKSNGGYDLIAGALSRKAGMIFDTAFDTPLPGLDIGAYQSSIEDSGGSGSSIVTGGFKIG